MHLSRILDQIKRHPSPTEALTKLGKAMDKHEDNLLEKGFRILKSELCANVYEAINGPHFDEEHAKYAVEGMENEDGSKGPHWTVEETTSIANQMGINLKSEKHNKWDWYVAMNMIYSDFYKAVVAITGGASTKPFAELTKAWICDKDISEGKMWHYYVYIMCDDEDNDYKAYEHMSHDREYDSDYKYGRERRSSGRMSYPYSRYEIEDEYEYSDRYAYPERNRMDRDRREEELSVSEDKTMMTDSTIGLTIATDKTQIVDMVKQSYNDCKVKKESVLKYDEEMRRCEDILKLLNTTPDITTNVTKDFKELDELKAEVKELKQLLQNVTTVRPEVKIETPSSEEKQIEI